MIQYYISQMAGADNLFKLAKFNDSDQPENVYFVVMKEIKDKAPEMHCDCPNRRRGKHVNDKHGQMVAKWLLAGKPNGYFDKDGNFHGNRGNDEPAEHAAGDASGDQEPGADFREADENDSPV